MSTTTTPTLVRVHDPKAEYAGNRLHDAYLDLRRLVDETAEQLAAFQATPGRAGLDSLIVGRASGDAIAGQRIEVQSLIKVAGDLLTAEQVERACTPGQVRFIHALPAPADPTSLNLPDDVAAAAVTRGVPVSTTDPLLTYNEAASFLTDKVGRPTTSATLRSYRRNGLIVVPDLQVGGDIAGPEYRFPSYPGQTREPMPPDPSRPWTERERVGARSYWLQSSILAWNEGRLGSGRVAGRGTGALPAGEAAPRRRRRTREELSPTPA